MLALFRYKTNKNKFFNYNIAQSHWRSSICNIQEEDSHAYQEFNAELDQWDRGKSGKLLVRFKILAKVYRKIIIGF